MIWIFWSALVFLMYTLFGYPLLLWIVSLFRSRPVLRGATHPTVALIIPVHNEASRIEQKIENTLGLIYPEDRREILVACDGSTDDTALLVRSYANRGVKLIETSQRRGKHYAQMFARDASRGEILVFTDAAVRLEPEGLLRIVSNFADPTVGCVSSEDKITTTRKGSLGEDSYVGFDKWLRRLESQVSSLVSMSGSFFAARRSVCSVWDPQKSSDFFLALQAVMGGQRAVVDPGCRGIYGLTASEKTEYHRKVRTIVHGLDVFFSHAELMNPVRFGFFSWQLISHKFFRWLVPIGFLAEMVSCAYLAAGSRLFGACLAVQVFVCILGLFGLASERLRRFRLFRLPGFFLIGSAATLAAWAKFLSGERLAFWKPTQRDE